MQNMEIQAKEIEYFKERNTALKIDLKNEREGEHK